MDGRNAREEINLNDGEEEGRKRGEGRKENGGKDRKGIVKDRGWENVKNVQKGLTLVPLSLPCLFSFFLYFPNSSWCLTGWTAPSSKLVGPPPEGCVNHF